MRALSWTFRLSLLGLSLLGLSLLPGCSAFDLSSYGAYCPSGKVGLSLTLYNEAKNTDEIDLVVWVDGKMKLDQQFTRKPGGEKETVEIDLAHYEVDKYSMVSATVVAKLRGKVVAGGRDSAQIDNKCTALTIFASPSTLSTWCVTSADCTGSTTCTNNCCSNYCG
jgi:hypothetical protein